MRVTYIGKSGICTRPKEPFRNVPNNFYQRNYSGWVNALRAMIFVIQS